MNRKEILEIASKVVRAEDVDHDYGKPENNFATIADLWNTYVDASHDVCVSLDSRDVAAMMILLKVARAAMSTKCDHWVDIAGYAACGGEIDSPCTDERDMETIVLQCSDGPFELRFAAKKEGDTE